MFIILIVPSTISPKDTSIDLCRENIDTKASAKDILRKRQGDGSLVSLLLTFSD